ncbi:hypothetical protein YC2023_024531 [Brassica napus]
MRVARKVSRYMCKTDAKMQMGQFQEAQLYNITCSLKPSKRNRRGRDEESPTTCSVDKRFRNTRQKNSHRLPMELERGVRRQNSTTSRDEPEKKPLKQSNPHHDRHREGREIKELAQESVAKENEKKCQSNIKPGKKLREEASKDDATEAITSKRQKPAKTLLERHRFPESGPEGQESESFASSASSKGRAYKYIMENVSLCLSSSSNRRPSVRHSTFESLRLGRSRQSIASGFLRLWDSLNFKKDKEFVGITVLFLDEKVNSVIYGFTPVGRANHYMPSLKACSIVKVDRFEVARCSSMYKITDHPFLICFISLTIIDEVITGSPKINVQSRLDCSTISKRRKRQPRSVKLSKQKKQSKLQTLINTNNNDFCLHITHQIKETQTQSYQEIQETILTYTKAATTSPPAHSSYLLTSESMNEAFKSSIGVSLAK